MRLAVGEHVEKVLQPTEESNDARAGLGFLTFWKSGLSPGTTHRHRQELGGSQVNLI